MAWGPVLIFIAAMLWATDAPFRFFLTKTLDSNFIVLAEHAVNMLLVFPFIVRGWSEIKNLTWKQWLVIFVIGIGASAIATILFTKSFSYMNPSVAIVLQKLQPLIAISLAVLLLKENTGKRFWLWAGVALFGAYVISFPNFKPQLFTGETWDPHAIGVLLALGAATLWGAGTVLGRYLLQNNSSFPDSSGFSSTDPFRDPSRLTPHTSAIPLIENTYDRKYFLDSEGNKEPLRFQTLTALRFLVAFLFLIVLNIRSNTWETVLSLSAKDILFIVIIAITSGFTALYIYYRGLQTTKASIATLAELGFPFLAVIVNAAALGFYLKPMQIAGMLLLLFAVLKLTRLNRYDSPAEPIPVPQ